MYSYVKSVVLSRSIGSQWESIDISKFSLNSIYDIYSEIYLELSNPVLTNNVYVDLNSLKLEFSNVELILEDFLISIGDRTLDYVANLPTTEIKYVKYADAFRSEYKVDICKAGFPVPVNYPNQLLNDLMLSRDKYKTDMSKIHSHCLVSVNGYYHTTDADIKHAYVIDAAKTMRKSRHNQMGILSFLDVGKLTKVKIDPAKIVPMNDIATLKEKVYFSVTEDLTNKSVFLVLGGYLVFQDDEIFYQNGDSSFVLNLNNIQYVEKIYESNQYLDLSDLGLNKDFINPEMINLEQLWSDSVIKKYMTLSQSFLVIVDKPRLSTNKIHLRSSNLPGMFTSYQDPVYPLIVNYGKVAEYWKTYEDGFWAVNVQDSFVRNYILSEQPQYYLENVNNNLVPNAPYKNSRGFLLEISGHDN